MKIPFFFLRLFTVQIIFLIAYHSLSAAEQIRESRFGVVEQQFKNPSKGLPFRSSMGLEYYRYKS